MLKFWRRESFVISFSDTLCVACGASVSIPAIIMRVNVSGKDGVGGCRSGSRAWATVYKWLKNEGRGGGVKRVMRISTCDIDVGPPPA